MGSINPQGDHASGARIVGGGRGEGPGPEVMAAATLDGDKVVSSDGEHVGKISDIMLDVRSGRIAYAVLSEGGFLGMGATLHAIPWNALTLDTAEKSFRVDITAQRLKDDPGFDKDHWPSMADRDWATSLHSYYSRDPYWIGAREAEGDMTTLRTDLPPEH
ncbi:PRC-barrel domain-containing protein [Paraburkholderia sp. MMS20-SJTN17]|uniref:PRC-barrel domain-containing protein n=1 Tax=Paraburkholderia translucens TaxID=2886945 RepID=A0ABS8K7E8_9BURK|nr:PRC-barrel domain-containing protein [Paraburkholderia sp. MMS20-SJTN17]MCC8400592.1 PRC-barrel domain-containing protein [Paraburkholderia sp. MMS20-SJTN17]